MENVRIFLNCEFSDLVDMNLISIALVADNGKEFYAEVPFDESLCNEFVKQTVIPLLGRQADCKRSSIDELRSKLLAWLSQFERVVVLYDFFGDFALLLEIFANVMPRNAIGCANIQFKINREKKEQYFNRDGVLRHHALHDARANRYSYEPNTYFS
jgi:hypothetical protein